MLGEEERQPALARNALDEPDGLARLLGRHARRRLVEEEDLGLEGQRDAELELLLVAVGGEPRDFADLFSPALFAAGRPITSPHPYSVATHG